MITTGNFYKLFEMTSIQQKEAGFKPIISINNFKIIILLKSTYDVQHFQNEKKDYFELKKIVNHFQQYSF